MPLRTRFSRRIPAAVAAVALSAAIAAADTVKLVNRPAFRNVRIIDCQDGRIHFRGVSRQILRKPLAEVEWLGIDALPELDHAERPTHRDWRAAARACDGILARTREPWQRTLVRLRRVQILDRTAPFDEAVAAWLDLLADGVPGAAEIRPRHPGPPGDPHHAAARALLRTAREVGRIRGQADELLRLELELLLWDEVEPLPPPFRDWARQPAPEQPLAEDDAPPPMFADVPLSDEGAPRLRDDSFVFRRVDEALDLDQAELARRRLDRFDAFAPLDSPAVTLRAARLRLAEAPADALDLLAGLADSDTALPIAAAATYYEGLACERLDRPGRARACWRRLAYHPGADDLLRAQAAARLERAGREQP